MNEAISLENISKSYGNNLILNNLNLTISYGKVLCISGSNGSGKSTLIRILAGLIKADSGDLLVDGNLINKSNSSFRRRIGVLLDSNMIYENMTVFENLKLASALYSINDTQNTIKSTSKILGISHLFDTKVKELSKGFKKRTELTKILLHQPDIILLDEPEINLDEKSVQIVKDIINTRKSKGAAILVCTHSKLFLRDIGQEFGSIENGKIILTHSR